MFENVPEYISTAADGLWITVGATVAGIAIAAVLSFVFGLAMLSRLKTVRVIARIYVEIWRGTSEVVQLYWVMFALPILLGYRLVPLLVGILVLGLNFGAYGAEIVRGAVQSVPRAQYEGTIALSMTPAQRMRRVILPQALVEMVPPFNNLFIQLLKGSALLTIIGVSELTHQGKEVLIPRNVSEAATIWTVILLFYLLLAILITMGMRWLERRAAALVGRQPTKRDSVFARFGGGKDPLPAEQSKGGLADLRRKGGE
ncbi:ectoine/hydroxyectoine ABC transporter permease subunit EhuC [Actinophytocola gossypii]|uniref:Ectoine/hydroxyectoine ABC transporter permease subunit EhuC n=1 Tax=Actinophytocola gossypii TaxID=2812003 RepID=A0ABT2JB17_9PSEU|nr:ectoine/hydroxyectoine ABC transporter permease subunit EhuC [Actinophytocola gossypii]MCT2585042.1 ectoine/hydroxyectoine ABC transporter permease subunit EhuC [Actinophytocola gossypii]